MTRRATGCVRNSNVGHDAEVAAAAAQRPEQVGVLVGARVDLRAVGEHDVGAEQVVDRQAEAPGQVADAAAEREPADAGGRDDPDGVARPCACVAASTRAQVAPPPTRTVSDAVSTKTSSIAREVDHDTVVDDPEAGAVVAAAAHGERQRRGARANAIVRATSSAIRAAGDQRWVAVDHRRCGRRARRRSPRRRARRGATGRRARGGRRSAREVVVLMLLATVRSAARGASS